eukprot:6479813-Amphidinium_carterae.1
MEFKSFLQEILASKPATHKVSSKRSWDALESAPVPTAKARKLAENARHIGGMQSPSSSVAKLPVLAMTGLRVRQLFSSWVSSSVPAQQYVLAAVVSPCPSDELVESW